MKTTLVAATFVLIAFTSALVAAEAIPKRKWSGAWDTIERVYPFDQGYGIVFSEDIWEGGESGCDGGRQFYVGVDDPNFEDKARTLLAAFLGGREVSVWWDTEDNCRAHINRFQVR